MSTLQLHVLDPRGHPSQIPDLTNWIGVLNGKLVIKRASFIYGTASMVLMPSPSSIQTAEFPKFWIPPEMTVRSPQPFQALITFDEKGEIEGLDYVLGDISSHGGTRVIWMAGNSNALVRDQKRISVTLSVTDMPPLEKCSVTFPVVLLGGEKRFALPDGWYAVAIPALDDFRVTEYLAYTPGAYDRWEHTTMNVDVVRKGVRRKEKVIATGCVSTTGGMGASTVFSLPQFTDPRERYPCYLDAKRFAEGDRLRIQFAWLGSKYPVVDRFRAHYRVVHLIPPPSH
ncbi:MAG: hypothetical protein UY44_C0007G0034 [Candidatus Kaiserbacteria bacterium GW2011_GWA2_49_19]|uniref:Uncharacterized protein n=2 Tax=Candidatus Kaiseribacteriota TaxID=1752734 RepID=A0A0G1Y1J6_9BACT|nr:MAG: hypothetical protein UY44_C0007G0034 [Candidatus Kaiserbacteria bacterium GW2011_GWA2_49_19]OGG60208.1 MAG: hypothetical protein A3C86_03015 [Candidatus Kaiserbacteria bacterium RIFCSPHIGHO2_02_FULL_49_16]